MACLPVGPGREGQLLWRKELPLQEAPNQVIAYRCERGILSKVGSAALGDTVMDKTHAAPDV